MGETNAEQAWQPPDEIFLQAKGKDPYGGHEVTWCEDRVLPTDVRYVRADRARPPEGAARWAVEQPTIGCDEPSYYVYHSRYAAEVAASESDFLRVVRIVVIPTDRGENDG